MRCAMLCNAWGLLRSTVRQVSPVRPLGQPENPGGADNGAEPQALGMFT